MATKTKKDLENEIKKLKETIDCGVHATFGFLDLLRRSLPIATLADSLTSIVIARGLICKEDTNNAHEVIGNFINDVSLVLAQYMGVGEKPAPELKPEPKKTHKQKCKKS